MNCLLSISVNILKIQRSRCMYQMYLMPTKNHFCIPTDQIALITVEWFDNYQLLLHVEKVINLCHLWYFCIVQSWSRVARLPESQTTHPPSSSTFNMRFDFFCDLQLSTTFPVGLFVRQRLAEVNMRLTQLGLAKIQVAKKYWYIENESLLKIWIFIRAGDLLQPVLQSESKTLKS